MVKTSRYLSIGPGGRNCSCCFPAPRSKDRRKQYRIAKRKADREAMKNAEADLVDCWAEMEEIQHAFDLEDANFRDWCDHDYCRDDDRELQMQQEDDECDWDDYDDDYYDYGDSYYVQSEQEKVARALSVALIGDENDWRQHLTHAKDFIAAMKRNTR